jgi:glycosyltransferase involved in cell wall biosynthesis
MSSIKTNPVFSVIVPTFSRAELLLETIASIQKQNFNEWKLIIVDDGSVDNTAQVVE